MSRVRSTIAPVATESGTSVARLLVAPYTVSPVPWSFPFTRNFKWIADIRRKDWRRTMGSHRSYQPVAHTKWELASLGSWATATTSATQSVTTHGGALYALGWPYGPQNIGDALAGYCDGLVTTYWGGDVLTRHHDRWLVAKPSMTSRANMFVFLAELRDVKTLWDIIPWKHLRSGKTRLKSWSDVKTVLDHGNNAHLNYNFGWRPFIGDLRNTWSAVSSLDSRLEKFMANQNKLLRRNVRDEPTTFEGTQTVSLPSQTQWNFEYIYSGLLLGASTFEMRYTIPYDDVETLAWRALLDTLGLRLKPSNIWALLPWSFVVDWFVDVGGMISEHCDSDWIEPAIQVQDAGASKKMIVNVKTNAVSKYSGTRVPGPSISWSRYVRRPGFPFFSAETDNLDADKIRLLGSLLYGLTVH